MRSASWMATMMYGVISSVRPRMSSMSNCSGSLSTKSSNTALALSSTEETLLAAAVPGLEREDGGAEALRLAQLEANLRVGVEAKGEGRLRGEILLDVRHGLLVVQAAGREGKPGKYSIPSRSSSLK